tara:strand:+ start:660 stop:1037 length:378 start_codon:yes stop_codon:yes gene_type:complete
MTGGDYIARAGATTSGRRLDPAEIHGMRPSETDPESVRSLRKCSILRPLRPSARRPEHGFFEVAENFYTHFLPQAEELGEGNASIEAVFEEIRAMPEHLWREGMSPEQRAEIDAFYQERYGAVPR